MFLKRRSDTDPPPSSPRWLSWLVIIVMGYLIFESSRTAHPVQPVVSAPVIPAITEEKYSGLKEMTDAEQCKRKLNPDYAAKHNCTLDKPEPDAALTFKVIEDLAGEGEAAQCGDTIAIHLTVWGANGKPVYEG